MAHVARKDLARSTQILIQTVFVLHNKAMTFPRETSVFLSLSPLNEQRIHLKIFSFKTIPFWHSTTASRGDQQQYRALLSALIKLCCWEAVHEVSFQFLLSIVVRHICVMHLRPGSHKALYQTSFHPRAVNAHPTRARISPFTCTEQVIPQTSQLSTQSAQLDLGCKRKQDCIILCRIL